MEARLRSLELLLLRHAEAERKADTDMARALTPKGREDATQAGRRLAASGLRPDVILSSPAARALETARLAGAELGCDIRQEPLVYDASREVLAKCLATQTGRRVMVVGHNPGLSDLASWLASLPSGWSLGKGATAHLRLRAAWNELSRGCGRLVDVIDE